MTTEQQIALLDSSIHATQAVRDSLAGEHDRIHVHAGESIQAAIDAAPHGATIVIEPATYDEALVIGKSVMLAPSTPLRHGRATNDASVWVTSAADATILVTGTGITITGIGIRNRVDSYDAVDIYGARVLFDRCTALGDPAHGMRRGWLTHGTTTRILGCYCDDVFNIGRDTCCIGGWEGGADIIIDDCYLCGGAEGILYGGADCSAPDKIPHHITITHSTITKNPAWFAMGVTIKNALELKAADHVYIADCVWEYAGISGGQAAYLIVLTVRNQDGNAPWSHVEDVLIERCVCRYGGGGVSFLGHDDSYSSGSLDRVTLRNVKFTGMSPDGIWAQPPHYGSGWGAMFNNAPLNVTLDGITMEGTNMHTLGNFANVPNQPVGLVMRNWKYFPSEYGWKIDGGSMDVPPACDHLRELMPDLVYEITASDEGAVDYPSV